MQPHYCTPAASWFHIIVTLVSVHSYVPLVHMHTGGKSNGHPQASELLTTPEEPIVPMAICRVPEVGRDERILCSSHSGLNEALALVWVGKGASGEATASQVSINHLLSLTFSTINPELWLFKRQKTEFCDYSWYLMTAWAWIDLCCHQSSIFILLYRKHTHHMPDWMKECRWRIPTA